MYRVGIDTGGTFTDAVLFDEEGNVRIFKAPTTPEDFSSGVMNCLKEAATGLGMDFKGFLGKVELIAHGTTVTTNVVLTKTGAKIGAIATKGFRDMIEIRRAIRPDRWDRKTVPVKPLAPRHLHMEVDERILYNGEVLTPLNEDSARSAVKKLKEEGVEAIAVTLLFSFINPVHEKKIAEIISQEYPGVYTGLSSEVLPRVREYERTSTTMLDAYVAPSLVKYVTRLQERLKENNFSGELLLMQANGGVQAWDVAIKRPVGAINSGPAAAFPCSLYFAELMDVQDVLSIDMGGTSFDVGLVKDRTIKTIAESEIARFKNAFPAIDVLTIGAGGGSIAWIDPGAVLRVGPQSAGAMPGPACYGTGGEEPTVTDANLILGYLSPDYFLGGRMKLDAGAANKAVEKLAVKFGGDVVQAANAVFNIVNEVMCNAIIRACVRRGYDPRDFLLVVGGGAGAAHAVRLAQTLGISRVLIPKVAPTYCALGLAISDLKHDYVHSYITPLREADFDEINRIYGEMEREARAVLKGEGVAEENITFQKEAEMRYVGQWREIEIDVPEATLTKEHIPTIEDSFHKRHEQLYTYAYSAAPMEIQTLRGVAVGSVARPPLKGQPSEGKEPSQAALKTERQVFFSESQGFVKTPIYDGDKLRPGNIIEGPAVIEEVAVTIVIPPKVKFSVDQYGNYISAL